MPGIHILKGIKVDILDDGSLDMDDEILKELDIVICSVHYKFKLSEKEQTRRVISAIKNRYATMIGHPTGRMINQRRGIDLNMDEVIHAAHDYGCMLELNAHPDRLDLTDIYCRAAKEAGILVGVNTDAHNIDGYNNLRFGIGQARRGWLEKDNVLNTRSYKELMKLLNNT